MQVIGTEGSDTLYGGLGDDIVRGLAGDDLLGGGGGQDVVSGGAGDDILAGGAGNDTGYGGSGNDSFLADSDSSDVGDSWFGGIGTDVVTYTGAGGIIADAVAGTVQAGLAVDLISGIEGLVGTEAADHVTGSPLLSLFNGRGGDDTFVFSGGAAVLQGGSGRDTLDLAGLGGGLLTLSLASGTLVTAAGDLVTLTGFEAVVGAALDSNLMTGSSGDDRLTGGSVEDGLFGGDGADSLSGGAGRDFLAGGAGSDSIDGGEGGDSISTDGGDDSVSGGDGDDVITAADGAGSLSGGEGNDLIFLHNSTADADAGGGDDLVRVSFGAAGGLPWAVSGGAGFDTAVLLAADGVQLDGFERILGSLVGETVRFSGSGVEVLLGDGNDAAATGTGNLVYGGGGEDSLTVTGAGVLHGGSGDDTITDGTGEAGAEGWALVRAGRGDDVVTLTGIAADIFGGRGEDLLRGAGSVAAEARIHGGDGNDILLGDRFARLFGDAGDDRLACGDEVIATGGEGADVFVFAPDPESSRSAMVTDFTLGSDRLEIAGIDNLDDLAGMRQLGSGVLLRVAGDGGADLFRVTLRDLLVEELSDAILA